MTSATGDPDVSRDERCANKYGQNTAVNREILSVFDQKRL